jgi:hypothetical protein
MPANESTNFKWPANGLVVVLCEDGKYWAATVAPDYLEEVGNETDCVLLERYFQPAINFVRQLAAEERKKAHVKMTAKSQVAKKFAGLH